MSREEPTTFFAMSKKKTEDALPVAVEEKLEELEVRHADLETLISQPQIIENQSLYRTHTRELGSLGKKVSRFREYRRLRQELEENEELSAAEDDADLQALAVEEVTRLEPLVKAAAGDLLEAILVEDEDSDRNVIMEIRAGTGGDEAALFAADLFRMYSHYAEQKSWKIELLDASPTPLGGYKEVVFSVTGESVYGALRYEMGGHRVQRVPSTETSGRIHTSAATVACMGEPEDVEVDINEADLEIDYYRASGPGGQKVNKTSSAVRITHVPTGTVVAIQEESSQHKNRARAMRVLRSRIYEQLEAARKHKEQSQRRSQIGSGDRSARIRTYNFPQNRVTDHRIGANFNLEKVIQEGQLGGVHAELRQHEREERLKDL